MDPFREQRERMVRRQIAGRGVLDDRIIEAMRSVPRGRFVPDDMAESAYADSPLPIGEGQTISQPYVVAMMVNLLELQADDRVLEVGAGSGYAAAVIGRIAREVFAIERFQSLADRASVVLRELGADNIEVRCADGTRGWPEHAPYDAILVSAGGPDVPRALLDQLTVGGRLVIPVGSRRRSQQLIRVRRMGAEEFEQESLGSVSFVPLVGAEGWNNRRRFPWPRREA